MHPKQYLLSTGKCVHCAMTKFPLLFLSDHIPYWCPCLEVSAGSCSGLPPRALLSHPGTKGRSSLCSMERWLLFVPFARRPTSTNQAHAFSVVGPSVRRPIGLPLAQRLLPCRVLSDTFYSSLNTVLFSRSASK